MSSFWNSGTLENAAEISYLQKVLEKKITVNKPFSKNDPLQRKSLYFNQVGLFCFTFFILQVILDYSWTLDNLGALCGICWFCFCSTDVVAFLIPVKIYHIFNLLWMRWSKYGF